MCASAVAASAPAAGQEGSPRSSRPDALPYAILVNQVGYYPELAKLATLRSATTRPRAWELRDRAGRKVASGKSRPMGLDLAAGERVHVIDFSAFRGTGRGFVLKAGAARSRPFDVVSDLYRTLKYDALSLYYHNRSGIDIAMPYAGQPEWARPAGHLTDKDVPCAPEAGCSYRLDVSGGWYDAGDHGKYVVNGGISVWTLLNLYERASILDPSSEALADGSMRIPEGKNRVPDLLDEARWELEFMLKMQVPAGKPMAGMVHHKIHDQTWTGLGLAPHEDPKPRFLYPVSTAATLNLAAVAAQAARIWKSIDPGFADRCLKAAQAAWAAANAHPRMFAKAGGVGGGPYQDDAVEDEFYWAAAELAITSGRPEFRQRLVASPLFLQVPTFVTQAEGRIPSSMTWQEVGALGTLSLALVPGALPPDEQQRARQAVIRAAEIYLAIAERRGFRIPVDWGEAKRTPWGSNSFLLNNMLVLALAADFKPCPECIHAVAAGMDYILGRNALDQSYVTGHGGRPLRNPHHRFWAKQANPKYPSAPPGMLSGGPNSGLQDPKVKAAGLEGCAPEKCFLDHIESYATNEIAINWNAPFAWVLFYLDSRPLSSSRGRPR